VIAVDREPPHEFFGLPVVAGHVVDPDDSAARSLGKRLGNWHSPVGLDLVATVAGNGDRFCANGIWAERIHRVLLV
jgi:hypothetical protein